MKPSSATATDWQSFGCAWMTSVLWRARCCWPSTWRRGLVLCCLGMLGCASQPQTLSSTDQSAPSPVQRSTIDAVVSADAQYATDLERLAQLWQQRTKEHGVSDYPIGPGDVIEISVPAMDEINDRTIRVSGDGKIALPLVGTICAAGLTEEELRDALRGRLEQFMHVPQLNLFVREYRSRQVAVIGAVSKPGLYTPASEMDIVLDMVALAGGMTSEAAARILLIPAERAEPDKARDITAALPVQLVSKDAAPLILKRTDPIVIDLKDVARGGQQQYLPLPVRPGDVIMVPGGGEVLVQG
jgi:protein involved in polysaccharide export with SLBB domain